MAPGRPTARLLAYAVVVCLAGAALALLAVTRVWSVQVTARPGLPDLRVSRTGADLLPLLPALALTGLAGVGALLATRGRVRRALGALLAVVGGGLAVGAVTTRTGLDPGAAGAAGTLWPVVAVLGGALLVVGGWWALRHGHRWPAMGARYDRVGGPRGSAATPDPAAAATPDPGPAAGATPASGPATGADGSRPAADQRRGAGPVDTRAVWDALDRGDDPTAG